MESKTIFKPNIMDSSKVSNLPILRHFNESEIGKSMDSFRKGELNLFRIVKLAALGAVGYLSWVYVLPPLFMAIGQFLATAATVVLAVGLMIAAPVIIKGLRMLTRGLHKAIIKHDPFLELEKQKQKMIQNKLNFRKAKGRISGLQSDMETAAGEEEERAKELEKAILSNKKKADKHRASMQKLQAELGNKASMDDDFIHHKTESLSAASAANRMGYQYEQAKTLVSKYGTRGHIMKKMSNKLKIVEATMEIKIQDFDSTIDILKKDYEFAQKSREATQTAKDAMLFTKSWELEYALDVVTTTIAEDIAVTAGNLNDIESLTSTYAMDDDQLYDKLDLLADNIRTGQDPVASADDYSREDYRVTAEDKRNSGGFGNMFQN